MKLAALTLLVDEATGRFDDAEVRAFCEAHEVIDATEHMVIDGAVPRWAMLIRYRERARSLPPAAAVPRPAPTEEAPLEVPVHAQRLFDVLRRWRNERAKRDGRPSYVLFHNRQVLAIALARPATLAELGQVDGVGEAKLRDYGAEILALIAQTPVEIASPPPEAP